MTARRDLVHVIATVFSEIAQELAMGPRPPAGEGEERWFRTLLRDKLLIGALGWPQGKLLSAELYDLYGLDLLNDVVLYIETKTPRRKTVPKGEVERFESKLTGLGTCEVGAITDGHTFVLYDSKLTPSGVKAVRVAEVDLGQVIRESRSGRLSKKTAANLERTFGPLRPERFLRLRPLSYEHEYGQVRPSGQNLEANRRLSAQLRGAADVLTEALEQALLTLLTSRMPVGSSNGSGFDVWAALDDWSTYSGRVPPTTIESFLRETLNDLLALRKREKLSDSVLRKRTREVRKELGVKVSDDLLARLVARALASGAEFETELRTSLMALLQPDHVSVFARQTSYVVLSRLLLYRVAEDKDLVQRKLSSSSLDRFLSETGSGVLDFQQRARALRTLIDEAAKLMSDVFYPHLYVHGLFDWWAVPQTIIERYDDAQSSTYRRIEREIDIAVEQCVRILNRFQLDRIERDIWKDVYQEYLPAKERARLGGFYTPDEVVSLILDMVGYTKDSAICSSKLLDPACGSGSFIVEAAKRLRAHLEETRPCHADFPGVADKREASWRILERLINNLYAIDIHPFACFLTEMNFLLLTVDLLLDAKQLDHSRKVKELNVGCDDSLRPPEHPVQLKLSQFVRTNSRADRLVKDREKARTIKEAHFDDVVGNPPWSGVLRGKKSPLFDDATKNLYKRYRSATDKYDLYVLFVERGISWLKPSGRLGFVTQNRFLRRKYGRGLRLVIKENCKAIACIDMGPVGKLVFPGRTNYPCINIWERLKDAR